MTTALTDAIERIQFARHYTERLLEDVQLDDWFCMPGGAVTHLAWQVGHLAMAQYRLALARLRPELPDDEQLIPLSFRQHFGKGSLPHPDPTCNPAIADIQAIFARVHARVMQELPEYPEDALAEPVLTPHAIATTRLDALHWCAAHELIHAGQIALLRRGLGKSPRW
jgi:hypothetical protein